MRLISESRICVVTLRPYAIALSTRVMALCTLAGRAHKMDISHQSWVYAGHMIGPQIYNLGSYTHLMNESDIIYEINKEVGSVNIKGKPNLTLDQKYSSWYIGVTDNPDERKSSHKSNGMNVTYWRSWPASSETIARSVEKYFIKKGMDGDAGGGMNPTYVYIF